LIGKELNILVSISSHFFQGSNELVGVDVRVNVWFLFLDEFGSLKLDIRDVIFASFNENWDDFLSDDFLSNNRHDCSKRLEAAHSVVVPFLISIVMLNHFVNIFACCPIWSILLC